MSCSNFILACSVRVDATYLTIFSAPPAAPGTLSVTFPIPGQQFTVTWDEPPLSMGGTVDTYFVNVSGPNDLCGSTNTLQRVTERSYECSRWSPAGQRYTFTVAGATCGGDLRGPESEPVTVTLQGMYGDWRSLTYVCMYMCLLC